MAALLPQGAVGIEGYSFLMNGCDQFYLACRRAGKSGSLTHLPAGQFSRFRRGSRILAPSRTFAIRSYYDGICNSCTRDRDCNKRREPPLKGLR
jgi:hypothetical protein